CCLHIGRPRSDCNGAGREVGTAQEARKLHFVFAASQIDVGREAQLAKLAVARKLFGNLRDALFALADLLAEVGDLLVAVLDRRPDELIAQKAGEHHEYDHHQDDGHGPFALVHCSSPGAVSTNGAGARLTLSSSTARSRRGGGETFKVRIYSLGMRCSTSARTMKTWLKRCEPKPLAPLGSLGSTR